MWQGGLIPPSPRLSMLNLKVWTLVKTCASSSCTTGLCFICSSAGTTSSSDSYSKPMSKLSFTLGSNSQPCVIPPPRDLPQSTTPRGLHTQTSCRGTAQESWGRPREVQTHGCPRPLICWPRISRLGDTHSPLVWNPASHHGCRSLLWLWRKPPLLDTRTVPPSATTAWEPVASAQG